MEADAKAPIEDPGLYILILLLRLIGAGIESQQLPRNVASPVGVKEMVRLARTAGLAARCSRLPWTRLASGPLPAIAVLRKGSFLLLGRVAGDTAIVLAPDAERSTLMTRDQFEAVWDGRLVFVKKRGALATQVEQSREAAVRHLQQLWKTSLTRANGISRNLVDVGRNSIQPDAEKETPSGAAIASAGIIILSGRSRKFGRAVARIGPGGGRPRHDEIAFLPAALEIVETPPSPLGRAIAFSIVAVFIFAVAWACLGTVDIVAIAPGKVIPSGRTKTIQPFETGVVRSIKVHDGQAVKSGDVLIELDTTITAAELSRLKGDLLSAQLDVARTMAALARNEDPLNAFKPPADATPAQIEMHRRFLASQAAEQNAKLAAIDQQVKQKEAERATFEASVEKIKAVLAPLQQRVEIRQQLFQKELGSKLTYLTEYQEYVAQQQEISVMQRRSSEAAAAISVLMETRTKALAEYERGLFESLAKAEEKAAGLTQDAIKAEQRTSLQRLTAPIDGTVQQLAIHTIGGVVTPAQMLMLIVPIESRLEIEAMVSNRDIGFVELGQGAAIKIDTFNFTRYGLLQGKVLSISQDAITRTKPMDRGSEALAGAEASSSEPKGQELVYAARISIDRSQMEIENKRVNLSPGMAVTVEIKTGSRRIISYLLSPLARYKQESLRER